MNIALGLGFNKPHKSTTALAESLIALPFVNKGDENIKYSAFETWWHTRRNQISSFAETDEYILIGVFVSSVDYRQPMCAHHR